MTLRITNVHFEGTSKTHQSITRYFSIEDGTGNTFDRDKATMIDWLENKNITAYVNNGGKRVEVRVWKDHPKCLRTVSDGYWSDNLLALETY